MQKSFVDLGFETFVDTSAESVSKKVRTAQLELYNYILTVGDREVEEQNISLRTRDNIVHGAIDVKTFVQTICIERDEKMLTTPYPLD